MTQHRSGSIKGTPFTVIGEGGEATAFRCLGECGKDTEPTNAAFEAMVDACKVCHEPETALTRRSKEVPASKQPVKSARAAKQEAQEEVPEGPSEEAAQE